MKNEQEMITKEEITREEYDKMAYSAYPIAKFFWHRFLNGNNAITRNVYIKSVKDINTKRITLDTEDKEYCLVVDYYNAFGFNEVEELANLLIKFNLIGKLTERLSSFIR